MTAKAISRARPVHLLNANSAPDSWQPSDLGYEYASSLMLSTSTIAICYYYSARKLILILPFYGGLKAEST